MESENKFLDLVDSIENDEWNRSSVSVNIPEHPEIRFASPTGMFEVEISPVNGYDDGKVRKEELEFFVNVYKYQLDEHGDRVSEDLLFSRKYEQAEKAILKAELKIKKLS